MREQTTVYNELLKEIGIANDSVFARSGDHSTGFFRHQLRVDLEDLAAGRLAAFTLLEDVHETSFVSFREYYGIDVCATLPDGAIGSSIADLCEYIWNRRDELTAGFDTEFIDGNWKAVWTPNEYDTAVEDAESYWDGFQATVETEVACAEVYDLGYSENVPFVRQAISNDISRLEEVTQDAIEQILNEQYVSDRDTYFIGYEECARSIYNRITDREG